MLRTALAAALLLAAAPALAREKIDVLVLVNGDHVTGEIKGMARGKLDLLTNDMGRVSVEWKKIVRVTTPFPYEIELADGTRYVGVLSSPEDGVLSVGLQPTPTDVPMSEVVEVVPMSDEFLNRIRAILDLGFTLAKSKNSMTLSTSGELGYRARIWGTKLTWDAYFQNDANSSAVSRFTVVGQEDFYFDGRWRAFLGLQLDHNDELALNLRASIAAGPSYALVRNDWNELWLTAGLIGSREQYFSGSPNYTLDGLVGASWEAFRYDSPKLDLTTSIGLMPGLSDWGRLRGTFTFKIKYELFSDFNVGLSFSDQFDTRPPDANAEKNDYIASVTVGWSYRR